MTILTRSKESNTENFNKFYETLSGAKIGHFVKDSFEGNFYKEMKKDMKGRDLNLADVSGEIFSNFKFKTPKVFRSIKSLLKSKKIPRTRKSPMLLNIPEIPQNPTESPK